MNNSPLFIICPGIHPPSLNHNLLQILDLPYLIFPDHQKLAFSPLHLLTFIKKYANEKNIFLIAFSAGVVSAIAVAQELANSQRIKGLIAMDGWGVPLKGDFPIYRLSHDYFTHRTSNLLGAGKKNFYADPPIPHLQLWQHPQKAIGYQEIAPGCKIKCTAAEFMGEILAKINNVSRI